jgi:hypothetical protein
MALNVSVREVITMQDASAMLMSVQPTLALMDVVKMVLINLFAIVLLAMGESDVKSILTSAVQIHVNMEVYVLTY